jgi:hypothetical protein
MRLHLLPLFLATVLVAGCSYDWSASYWADAGDVHDQGADDADSDRDLPDQEIGPDDSAADADDATEPDDVPSADADADADIDVADDGGTDVEADADADADADGDADADDGDAAEVDAPDACRGQPNFTPCTLVTDPDRSYDICVDGVCVSPGCGDASCNVPAPNWPLPDTAQRACSNASALLDPCPGAPGDPSCATTAFCGQDAQYGWDTTHPSTDRFVRTATVEPTVTDNITGLVWQGCPAGLAGAACIGTRETHTWADALVHCDTLIWAGFDDWRLPARIELMTIVDYGTSLPAVDSSLFPVATNGYYWTSTHDPNTASGSDAAWAVHFDYGTPNQYDSIYSWEVRCVRGTGGPATYPRYSRWEPIGGEPVVDDAATGLMWQGCVFGQTGVACTGTVARSNWELALAGCEALDWGGFTDWYLPSLIELSTIVDDRLFSSEATGWRGPVDPLAFPSTPDGIAWTSTPSAGSAMNAWAVYFTFGSADTIPKSTGTVLERCVRRPP